MCGDDVSVGSCNSSLSGQRAGCYELEKLCALDGVNTMKMLSSQARKNALVTSALKNWEGLACGGRRSGMTPPLHHATITNLCLPVTHPVAPRSFDSGVLVD